MTKPAGASSRDETAADGTAQRVIGVGLLGLGNVGAGVVRILRDNADAISARLGAQVAVRAIAVRDPDKARRVDVDPALLTTSTDAVLARDDIAIVCELMGGVTDARAAVLSAIARGKHVVTANKALLAERGEEVFGAAERAGVDLYYEAAVCGGVPIIRTLREGLASDRITALYGIVNGTSNYITSRMASESRTFADVLAEAQAAGYAEADPALDVSGGDAAHKLAILIALCFGGSVDPSEIHTEGIDRLDPVDFELAARFGYAIKPLAIARAHPDGIEARVHPTMVPLRWLLAGVPGPKNAVYVDSHALGPSLYYGAGAGMMPTAMSVVSDIIEVARNLRAGSPGALPLRSYQAVARRPVRPIDALESRYYMRFMVVDRPGVLGRITTILGEHDVSIAQVVQEGPRAPDRPVRVVVLTHLAREGETRRALIEIESLVEVVEPASVIRMGGR